MITTPQGGILTLAATPILVAAGEVGSGTDWTGYLLQGGPFAIILVLILLDKLAPTGERNRLREEVVQYKKELQNLNDKLLSVLPPLTDAAQVITRVGEMVEELQHPSYNRRPDSRGRGGHV